MPPAASTGTVSTSSTSASSGISPTAPRTWPPASTPWAMIRSQPASTACLASATEPTCQPANAPPACTRLIKPGSGVSWKNSTSRARPAASSTSSSLLRSMNGIKKLTPKGPAWACSTAATRSAKGIRLECSSMPRPPALLTAMASCGVLAPPRAACWIGTCQPTNSVKAVANMVAVSQSSAPGIARQRHPPKPLQKGPR